MNGSLPASFNKQAVRDLYLKVTDVKLNQATTEFLLYIMRANGLNGEIVDFC